MSDEILKTKIKKLAKKMTDNTLLDYELQGYLKTKKQRDIFIPDAKHNIKKKKKYAYVDQGQSGKFMIQTQDDKIAKKGYVWGIKAYGQKGRAVGDIDRVLMKMEKDNQSLAKGVIERSLKRRKK